MRATVDLDDPTLADVAEAWIRLTQYGEGIVFGRVSTSGQGVHLKVHGCDPGESVAARVECGDDLRRMEFDAKTRLKPTQIMFSSKPASDGAGEWSRDISEVMAAYRERCPDEVLFPEIPTMRRC
jgi:hypothetical protein